MKVIGDPTSAVVGFAFNDRRIWSMTEICFETTIGVWPVPETE